MKTDLHLNEEVITDLLETASDLVGIRTFFVGILDETFSIMKVFSKPNGSRLTDGLELPLDLSVCSMVTCDGPLVIGDTMKDSRTVHLQAIYDTKIGSYLGTPIVLEDGRLFGTLCAVDPDPYEFSESDIKTMKRLANILAAIIDKQQSAVVPEIEAKILQLDKLALVGQLAAGLAHEIRNPMQSVKGFIQLLFDENERSVEFKSIVLSELDRINQLVSDFLLITQPSAPKKESTSISKLMKSTIGFLQSESALHNIHISLEEEEHIPDIAVDPSQMKQVFINLLKNAIEAIGEKGHIRVSIGKSNECVIINIKDSGKGIPVSIINKVGNPFFSTKENGVGLGLSICKTIVREHHGKLVIENHDDGTLIIIQLPLNI
ncbi:MAG TPA: ATP-binding protein [Bacillus sp. (in: firmicutes)]|nr:ATP-binding protein [Bacillus sp. (in: firmicutes)]